MDGERRDFSFKLFGNARGQRLGIVAVLEESGINGEVSARRMNSCWGCGRRSGDLDRRWNWDRRGVLFRHRWNGRGRRRSLLRCAAGLRQYRPAGDEKPHTNQEKHRNENTPCQSNPRHSLTVPISSAIELGTSPASRFAPIISRRSWDRAASEGANSGGRNVRYRSD